MNYNLSEWENIVIENNIIDRLNDGETFKSITVDLKQKGINRTESGIRKSIENAIKSLGYKYSDTQKLYYTEYQKDIINFMTSVDVEATIEEIAQKRIYNCFIKEYYKVDNLLEQIADEYAEISESKGIDFKDLIYMALLEGLEKLDPVDKTREFIIKAMNENFDGWFDDKAVIDFILKKEAEGYDLFSLYANVCDYDYLSMTEEEFQNEFKKGI